MIHFLIIFDIPMDNAATFCLTIGQKDVTVLKTCRRCAIQYQDCRIKLLSHHCGKKE